MVYYEAHQAFSQIRINLVLYDLCEEAGKISDFSCFFT